MAPTLWTPLAPRQMEPYQAPLAGKVCALFLALSTTAILSSLMTQKYRAVKGWRRLPWIVWLVFLIYASSLIFVFTSTIIQYGPGTGGSWAACDSAGMLCLVAYLVTKTFIYLFLVDRAHIIRNTVKSRLKSKLYIWNTLGMLSLYAIIGTLDMVYRLNRLDNGRCSIGIERQLIIPLIAFDAFANIYLTTLFLKPLMSSYSVRWRFWKSVGARAAEGAGASVSHSPNERLRTLARRTIIGCIGTLVVSLANVSVLLVLDGEVTWLCYMCCTIDILVSGLIIHWVTSSEGPSAYKTPQTGSSLSRSTSDQPFAWLPTPSSTKTWPGQRLGSIPT